MKNQECLKPPPSDGFFGMFLPRIGKSRTVQVQGFLGEKNQPCLVMSQRHPAALIMFQGFLSQKVIIEDHRFDIVGTIILAK